MAQDYRPNRFEPYGIVSKFGPRKPNDLSAFSKNDISN